MRYYHFRDACREFSFMNQKNGLNGFLESEMPNGSLTENWFSNYEVSVKEERNYCVGRVDIMNLNRIVARIGTYNTAKFHRLFLNSIDRVLKEFGGRVIKNIEWSLLFYFPDSGKDAVFGLSCIECGLTMIETHNTICRRMESEGLLQ